ncbi:S8 family peptidase [Clostridium sp.]|uniref:S8 family peptidase n=1 Tax=Clostridium sp. TaxID=1506 RepID=UPI002FCC3898
MISCDDNICNTFHREVEDTSTGKLLSLEEAMELYFSDEYETYFVEYTGDFIREINATDYARGFFINAFFGILYVKKERLSEVLSKFPEITNIERSYPYILLNLEESNEPPDLKAITKGNIPLDGEGVVVGIIGTGIDYLNPRFMDENGKTRIISIWDQTLTQGPIPENFFNGTEYTREDIDRAILAKNLGKDPYEIVNHKDEVGYGTAIANIVGGGQSLNNDDVVSVAPKCEFIIVKLPQSRMVSRAHWGLEDYSGLLYDSVDIAASGRYLSEMQQKLNKPVVMFLSIGTNLGAHDGSTMGERYVDFFARRNFSMVTSTGNQGGSPICFKSVFADNEVEKVININVDENQKNIFFSIYYSIPDRVSVSITPPLGETRTNIPIEFINGEEVSVMIGESLVYVQYFIEGKITGDQRFDFVIRNAVGGVWKLNLTKDYSIYGTLNMWLQQKEFSVGDTGIMNSTTLTTLMTPGTANNIIVTSSYDQIENIIREESGRGFSSDNRIIPSVALPAKNILTVGLNNKPMVVSGSAASGAILTGVVALLYQWAIVQGNDLSMYAPKIKSYLIQGTTREQDKVYPNPETGFGVLNIENLFRKLTNRQKEICPSNNKEKSYLYINIPEKIFQGLKF